MAASPRSASGALARAEAALRAHALAKPEATEHFPWGERAIKVKGKVFLFMYGDATRLSLSTKLPESGGVALMLPFAKPTGYGLGKAGWVSATFEHEATPPLEVLCAWVDESYQAVAPAKLASLARDTAQPATLPNKPARRTAAAKRAKPARRTALAKRAKPARRTAGSKPARPARRATAKPVTRSATARPSHPATLPSKPPRRTAAKSSA